MLSVGASGLYLGYAQSLTNAAHCSVGGETCYEVTSLRRWLHKKRIKRILAGDKPMDEVQGPSLQLVRANWNILCWPPMPRTLPTLNKSATSVDAF